MAQFSVIEPATQFDAKRAMWSNSNTDKMLAANYVRMGHLLDTQEKSNELQQCSIAIQSRRCSLAVKTNGLLSDMSSTLDDLKESLARTEDLLSKSLAVQQDNLMLDKRERILKDALFRWSEILANSEGLVDPQWVLIASRTLLAFFENWKFTTQDLQDAGGKRAFLDLTKRANAFVKQSDEDTVLEVDIFQALYAEYHELTHRSFGGPSTASVQTEKVPNLKELVDNVVLQCCGFRPSSPTPLVILCGLPAVAIDFHSMMSSNPPPMQGKRPLFGVYGRAGWVVKRFAVFTADAWYEIDYQSMFGSSGWVRKQYKQGSTITFLMATAS